MQLTEKNNAVAGGRFVITHGRLPLCFYSFFLEIQMFDSDNKTWYFLSLMCVLNAVKRKKQYCLPLLWDQIVFVLRSWLLCNISCVSTIWDPTKKIPSLLVKTFVWKVMQLEHYVNEITHAQLQISYYFIH